MLSYPAKFQPSEHGGFVVTFRDIPEAVTQGADMAEAQDMAAEVLVLSMEAYSDDRRPVPLPSKAKRSELLVQLPPSVSAKVLLLNEMLAQQKRIKALYSDDPSFQTTHRGPGRARHSRATRLHYREC